jgi:hypothetical protein
MMVRRRLGLLTAFTVSAALAMSVPARADVITEGTTDEANRDTSGTPPVATLHRGPVSLLEVFVNGANHTATDSDVEFDLGAVSTLPRGAVVSSAVLSLSVAGAQTVAGPGSVSVNGYGDGDGLVGLGDFVKATTRLGSTGSLADGPPGSQDLAFHFDVAGFIQSLANSRTPFVGFHLEGPANDSNAWVWGSAAADPAERPSLMITFTQAVPEPSVPALVGLGVVALSAASWCRRRWAAARADAGTA